MQTCTFDRSSFVPTLVVSPVVEQERYSDDRATDDTGVRFSDGRYSGTRRADKDAFYVCPPDPLPSHRSQRRTNCSWTSLAFASTVVNTGREGLD